MTFLRPASLLAALATIALVASVSTVPAAARTLDGPEAPALEATASGAITGRVFAEPFGGGTPVAANSGEVQFWANSGSSLVPAATTPLTSMGNFSLPSGLPAGQYRVAFVSRDPIGLPVREWFNDQRFGASANLITLTNGAPYAFGNVVLQQRTVGTQRFAGANRYETATEVSEFFLSPGAERDVVIVNGLNFPDALGAGPLAARLGGPLLMVTANAIPPETVNELNRLNPLSITIVGGTGVVSSAVEAQLATFVGGTDNVSRISAANRYQTSLAVVSSIGLSAQGITKLFIATGQSFPDALSAVPAAISVGGAILLVDGRRAAVDASTASYIDSLNVPVTIVGGTGVVSAGIQSQLVSRGIVVDRVSGSNRYATSIAIAQQYFPYAEFAYLANGNGFADALAVGPWAGLGRNPVYLTQSSCITDAVFDDLIDRLFGTAILVGGEGVLGPRVFDFEPCSL